MRGLWRAFWVLLFLGILVAAVALTAARLLEPSDPRWIRLVQLEAFTPYALVLYAAIGLVALVLLVRALQRGRGRVMAVVLLVIGALGLGAHASWFLPQVSGPNPPPAAGAEPLRVMTVNLLKGRSDGLGVVREATERRVDVLVLQEVTPQSLETMNDGGLGVLYPNSVGRPGRSVEGTMVFAALDLGETTDLPTSFDSFSVPVSRDDETWTLVAAHPAPPVSRAWAADHEKLAQHVRETEPDLVVGDLNATADHRPMRELADLGLESATGLTNDWWRPTWPARGLSPVPLVQIDHVLVGPRLAALATETVAIEGSDHRGLIVDVAAR